MIVFGQPRRRYAECGSTNDLAREWASGSVDPAPSGALVTAEYQTHGRGRRGHGWQADAGQSALMSFLYRLPPETDFGQLGLVTALAVTDALIALDFAPKLKWPNDILLGEQKAAGILVEVAGQAAVLGIGINVGQADFAEASGFAYPPTSLRLISGREQSVEAVIDAVAAALTRAEALWRREGFAAILAACRKCLAVGAAVRRGEASGTLTGLSDAGAARVRLSDGTFAEWTTVN